MLTAIQTRLKNQQIESGKYSLCYLNDRGEWKTIEHIGISVRPFQVVATYGTRPYIAIQKFGNRRNETDTRLFLINMRNGTLASDIENGASRILFDTNNESIYFIPLQSNGTPIQKYSWCLPRDNTPYMTINVPSTFMPNISKIDAKYNLQPIAEITIIEFKPRKTRTRTKATNTAPTAQKRPRGRPKGSKNKPRILATTPTTALPNTAAQQPKRPRGRPKGSKNKPRALTTAPVATPTIRKNAVKLRPVKKTLLGDTIYDVYINGKRVAENRTNATAETFMNNRILAVYSHDPVKLFGEYDLFWPDGSMWNTAQRHKYTGGGIRIIKLTPAPNSIKLDLSNNSSQTIRESELQRFALQQFVISNER